jgi:poly(A) polymerase
LIKTLIPVQSMISPAASQIFSALGAPEVDVRFVGGCVRDTLLKVEIKDIDISTPDDPQVVIGRLRGAGIKVIPTGLAYGTVTAVCDQMAFQITSLRKDTACYGRHAEVEYTQDWIEDASRRDFTFNALSLRPDGTLFDPFGGWSDAMDGRVKFVRNPYDRIQEDYLRILRFFRFQAIYGKVPPDPNVLKACKDLHSGLARLSAERVQGELLKILGAASPLMALAAMLDSNILRVICPQIERLNDLARLLQLEVGFDHRCSVDPWASRFVCLMADQTNHVAKKLKMSKKNTRLVSSILQASLEASDSLDPFERNHFLHKYDHNISVNGILIGASKVHQEDYRKQSWYMFFELAQKWEQKVLPISGCDIESLGVTTGPAVGEWLRVAESKWLNDNFTSTRTDLIRFLKNKITS